MFPFKGVLFWFGGVFAFGGRELGLVRGPLEFGVRGWRAMVARGRFLAPQGFLLGGEPFSLLALLVFTFPLLLGDQRGLVRPGGAVLVCLRPLGWI